MRKTIAPAPPRPPAGRFCGRALRPAPQPADEAGGIPPQRTGLRPPSSPSRHATSTPSASPPMRRASRAGTAMCRASWPPTACPTIIPSAIISTACSRGTEKTVSTHWHGACRTVRCGYADSADGCGCGRAMMRMGDGHANSMAPVLVSGRQRIGKVHILPQPPATRTVRLLHRQRRRGEHRPYGTAFSGNRDSSTWTSSTVSPSAAIRP